MSAKYSGLLLGTEGELLIICKTLGDDKPAAHVYCIPDAALGSAVHLGSPLTLVSRFLAGEIAGDIRTLSPRWKDPENTSKGATPAVLRVQFRRQAWRVFQS
jgi:hypothetical protein